MDDRRGSFMCRGLRAAAAAADAAPHRRCFNTDHIEHSVVLPALNEEKAVGVVTDRILSVFDREGLAGEVLVIDGCSSDRTGAIADGIAERDKRVRVIPLG